MSMRVSASREVGAARWWRWVLGLGLLAVVVWSSPVQADGHEEGEGRSTQVTQGGPVVKTPSKVPSSIRALANGLARGIPAATLAEGLSGGGSPVRLNTESVTLAGEIEPVFHSANPITVVEEDSLRALGATIVSKLVLPPSLGISGAHQVTVLVPHLQIDAAADLPWVVAITPVDRGFVQVTSEGAALHQTPAANALGLH